VQQRLGLLGFDAAADADGWFGTATRAALEAFQHRRGLKIDGLCGRQTWDTLVEAGFRLGDRLLYRRTPMLRGDDVADVQQRLAALGFDTGRVDGIFGDLTAAALREFQSNAGLPADGIVGTETLQCLRRMQQPLGDLEASALVSTVRARERLRQSPRTLVDRHVAIGETGGLQTTLTALARRLRGVGALATEFHHPDQSAHAQTANAAGAEVYLGMRLDPATEGCRTAYYAGYRDESPGGHRLAELVQAHVPGALAIADLGAVGMSVPVLRETRMTAVVVELGPAGAVVEQGAALADAVADALVEWARTAGD
jgi:N-acetylmuramoyl-L-alanine amidase